MSVEGPNGVQKKLASRQWSAATLQHGLDAVFTDVKREPWLDSSDDDLKERLKAGFFFSNLYLYGILWQYMASIMSSSSNQSIQILGPLYLS